VSDRELQAYHDGELGPLARWRVRRELARSARAREEIARLGEVGLLVREVVDEVPAPDLWAAIQARLPAQAPSSRERTVGAPPWLRWAAPAVAAAAALALVWTLSVGEVEAELAGSVRWLDAGDRSAVVLQDDREATIIWVLDPLPGSTSRRVHGALL
jgi:anti-sigma factor RsiW